MRAVVFAILWFSATSCLAAELSTARIVEKGEWLVESCGNRLLAATRVAMSRTPIVDFHTHTFNLHYLPVKGILVRYRLPPEVAGTLAKILLRATDASGLEASLHEDAATDPIDNLIDQLQPADIRELARHEGALRKAVARVRRQNEGLPGVGGEPAVEILEEAADDRITPQAARSLHLLLELLGDATHAEEASEIRQHSTENLEESAGELTEKLEDFLRLAALLMDREDRIARQLQAEFPLVDVFVHHMMDLAHVYGDSPRLDLDAQLRRVVELDRLMGDRLRFSVAFDPFRGEEAFAHVEKAVAAGAVAIKLYPPSGYQASETAVPWKPSLFTPRFPFIYLPIAARIEQRRQWQSRYAQGAEVIRRRIDRLVDLAVKHDTPIFSHHTPEGFQAMPHEDKVHQGYGELMAAPKAWTQQLARYPKLRLVLAHSGGGEGWFSPGWFERGRFRERDQASTFDRQAYELCVNYENVYCDFGFSTEVLDEKRRKAFARNLEQLAECGNPGSGCVKPRYNILEKLIYGSDWHVMAHARRGDMICSFGEVFSSDKLKDAAALFFGLNAKRAAPRLAVGESTGSTTN